MNLYMIIGNLVRDPETGATESGVNWCRFTVAARKKRPKEGEPDAEFVRVTAWRGLGDSCAKYLKTGRKVCVTGEPKVHAWKSREGDARGEIEMNADEVEFLSPAGSGRGAPTDADALPETDPESGYARVDPEEQPF